VAFAVSMPAMSRRTLPIGALIRWSAIVVVAAVVAWSLPIDDFWLTLASGRAIASGADLSVAMPFSWTPEVLAARNPQWGAQVLLGAHGSLELALAINGILLFAGVGVTAVRAMDRANVVSTAAALLIVMTGLAPHLLARAQSFSIALFPISLLLLDRCSTRRWLPLAYGAIILVWANLHGAFVVGQLAALTWLIAAAIQRRQVLLPLLTLGAAIVAPLANPIGLDLLVYAYGQPAVDVVRAISTEWQPSWPWLPLAIPFWVVLAIFVVGRMSGRVVVPLPEMLLLIALAILGASGIRHIPWFLLAVTPVVASDLDGIVRRSPRLARALGEATEKRGSPGWVLPFMIVGVVGFQLLRPSLPDGVGRLTPDEPVAAVDALADGVEPGDRLLNEQEWGGYVAYRLWPEVETAMDGRLEIRTIDTWAAYFDLMQGQGDPDAELRAAGVEWAVLGSDRRELQAALVEAGWEVIHDDEYAMVLRTGR
jgi:hypothetical protein